MVFKLINPGHLHVQSYFACQLFCENNVLNMFLCGRSDVLTMRRLSNMIRPLLIGLTGDVTDAK